MRKSSTVIALVAALSFTAGSALAGSTPPPSVGGAEAELGCAPTSQASRSSIDGTRCRELARFVFKFDTSIANLQQDLEELGQAQDGIVALLPSLGELDLETSVRLEGMMDRRAKFIATLSNLMKKISDTQQTLIQNLK